MAARDQPVLTSALLRLRYAKDPVRLETIRLAHASDEGALELANTRPVTRRDRRRARRQGVGPARLTITAARRELRLAAFVLWLWVLGFEIAAMLAWGLLLQMQYTAEPEGSPPGLALTVLLLLPLAMAIWYGATSGAGVRYHGPLDDAAALAVSLVMASVVVLT